MKDIKNKLVRKWIRDGRVYLQITDSFDSEEGKVKLISNCNITFEDNVLILEGDYHHGESLITLVDDDQIVYHNNIFHYHTLKQVVDDIIENRIINKKYIREEIEECKFNKGGFFNKDFVNTYWFSVKTTAILKDTFRRKEIISQPYTIIDYEN